jgi:hypothetical protein
MIRLVAALALISITATGADTAPSKSRASPDLTSESINSADPERNDAALITKAEVLLDRNHFSPGQIDGKNGENFRKALAAFQQTQKLNPTGKIDPDTWNALAPEPSAPVLKSYTISEEDWQAHLRDRSRGRSSKWLNFMALPTRARSRSSVRNFT